MYLRAWQYDYLWARPAGYAQRHLIIDGALACTCVGREATVARMDALHTERLYGRAPVRDRRESAKGITADR